MNSYRKKILFIVDNWVKGDGRAKVALALLNGLDKKKYNLSLLILRPEINTGKNLMAYPEKIKVTTIESFRFRKLIIPLSRFFINEKFEIIVTNVLFLTIPIISIAVKISKFFGTKSKIVIVNHVFFDFSNEFFKIKNLSLNKFLIKNFYKNADKIICVSNALSEHIKNLLFLKKEKCLVIYNPIIPDNFLNFKRKKPLEFSNIKGKIILGVGRLSFQKDFDTLINAVYLFKKKFKEDINCFIIGEGEEEIKLKNLVKRYGLDDSVHFLGYRENVYDYMTYADVLILSSIFEGFGLVLIEAMANGCPVIATDCPYGPKEIIQKAKSGILVPARDPSALTNAINRLLHDSNLTQLFINNGKKYSNNFIFKRIVSEYEKMLNSI